MRTAMTALTRARALPRAVIVSGATAAALLGLFCAPALAHITPSPASAPAGSTIELTFHVPNEESKADTTRVDMKIPTTHPIAQLLVKPIPGWKVSVRTVNLAKPVVTDDGKFSQAVSEVIWSGGRIAPGQFQDFSVTADPLPQGVSQLAFKTLQTYSDGTVVRWIDLPQPGQPEPAHPAPVLTLTKATAAVSSGRSTAGTGASHTVTAATAAGPGSDVVARALAAAALAVALLGLAAVILGRRRGRLAAQAEAAGVPAPSTPQVPAAVSASKQQAGSAANGARAATPRASQGGGSRPSQKKGPRASGKSARRR